MQLVKYKGEHYHACNPRKIGHDKYTCDAWGARSGRPIKSEKILDALAKRLMRKAGDDTIEAMRKHIKALQQENERLKKERDAAFRLLAETQSCDACFYEERCSFSK